MEHETESKVVTIFTIIVSLLRLVFWTGVALIRIMVRLLISTMAFITGFIAGWCWVRR